VDTVLKLRTDNNTKHAEQIAEDLLAFLTRWLAIHILESDRYLALVVQAIQSGKDISAAKQHATETMSGSTKMLIDIILSIYTSLSTNTLHLMQELAKRRRDQEILRQKQEQIFSLLENSPIAVRITSLSNGKVVFANIRYSKLVNLDVSEIIGMDPSQYYAAPDEYHNIQQQLSQGNNVNDRLVELSIPNVGRIWTLATYMRMKYEEEPAILGWFYDVTNIRKTEAELHFLTANISELISNHDSEGNYLFVTPACRSLIGYTETELLGRSCFDFFHPDDLPKIQDILFKETFVQNQKLTLSYRLHQKQGDFIWVESTVSITCDTNGKLTHFIATTRDITKRKQIETKLADNEARLRAIIENEPECIKIIDPEGNLLMINPAGLQMIAAESQEQVIGHPAINIVTPKYRQAFVDLHQRVLAGESVQLQFEAVGLKGRHLWLETHAVPMREDDGHIVHLAVTRDITEQKKADQQLRIAANCF